MGMVLNEYNLVNGKIKVDDKSKVSVNNSKTPINTHKSNHNTSSNVKHNDIANNNANSVAFCSANTWI